MRIALCLILLMQVSTSGRVAVSGNASLTVASGGGESLLCGTIVPQPGITSADRTSNVVTIDTDAPHMLATDDRVHVLGVGGGFDGLFDVVSAPTTTQFTYAQVAGDGSDSGGRAAKVIVPSASYPTASEPGKGNDFLDPDTGCNVRQVSENTDSSPARRFSTEYSTQANPNADGTRWWALREDAWNAIYNRDGTVEGVPETISITPDPLWHPTDPDIAYYTSGNALMQYVVSTDSKSTKCTVGGWGSISFTGETDIRRNGDQIALVLDGDNVGILTLSTCGLSSTVDFASASLVDSAYITPLGNVLIALFGDTGNNFCPTRTDCFLLYNSSMVLQRMVGDFIPTHHDVTILADDTTEVLIYEGANDISPPSGCIVGAGIFMITMDAGATKTCIISAPQEMGVHVGANGNSPWVLISFHDVRSGQTGMCSEPGNWADVWRAYDNSMTVFNVDTLEIVVLANHRSCLGSPSGYWPRPKGSMSWDGKHAAWTSNYLVAGDGPVNVHTTQILP